MPQKMSRATTACLFHGQTGQTAIKERVDLLELIGRDTRLRRVASTRGGEYAGPCPFCGGHDRLRVQPGRRRWRCRVCLAGERWQDAIAYVQRRDRVDDFVEACRRLGASASELGDGPDRRRAGASRAGAGDGARPLGQLPLADELMPSASWQARARAFVEECEAMLWSPAGWSARRYLVGRGLREETLRAWRVGFQPRDQRHEPAEQWGLPAAEDDGRPAWVWLPRGIVLPWFADHMLQHLKVRTGAATPNGRYRAVRGGHPGLYGSDTIRPDRPVIVVEAELCAQLVWQEAGDLLGVTSLGGC
jgi:hypothetical protein